MAYSRGTNPDRQSRVASESQGQHQVHGPLPLISSGGAPPPGQQSTALPVARVRALGQDALSIADASEFWLLADAVNPGQQFTELPPRAAARQRDYSITASFPLVLVGQDALTVGQQLTELPPRAALRARDYSHTQPLPLNLIGQDAVTVGAEAEDLPPRAARRASDYTFVQSTPLNLLGQDAVNPGEQVTDLAPRAAARARDYSIAASFPLELIGQDSVTAGTQLSGNAPAGPQRARDYTWLQSPSLLTIGPPNVLPIGQHAFDLPTPAAARARDYSIAQALPLNLIGQDALVIGQQLSGNAPSGPRRASTLSEPGVNLTLIISQAPPVIPCGLSTLASDLPSRGAARARDYSISASFPLTLVGKDQFFGAAGQVNAYDWSYQPPKPRYQQGTGEPIQDLLSTLLAVVATPQPSGSQSQDLPPRGAPRPPQAWTWAMQLALRGQDAVNPGVQISGNSPAGARRASDYTFLASFPLELIGQDAMVPGDQSTDLPPKSPQRARDYSWLQSFPLELIGKDATNPGGQFTDLPPHGPARLVDYSIYQGFNAGTFAPESIPTGAQVTILPPMGARRARDYSWVAPMRVTLVTPLRDLLYQVGTPRLKWVAGQIPPQSHWTTGPPQQ